MLKLPKTKKVKLSNGQVKWEQTETDYLPVAARIAWFRKEHPDWSIITKAVQSANKAVVMKAIIKDASGRIIATARKKETEVGFPATLEAHYKLCKALRQDGIKMNCASLALDFTSSACR